VQSIAEAKLWGVSLSTAFTSKSSIVSFLSADSAHIRIFAVVLIVLMGATTFFTQKQIIGRAGSVDPQQAMIQKVMLYGSPLTLAVFGFRFPIAVLLYWLTTNLWSMGQQFFVIRRMPPVQPLGPNGKIPGARPGASGGAGSKSTARTPAGRVAVSKPAPGVKPSAKATQRGQQSTKAGGAGRARTSRAPAGTSSRSSKATATARGGADGTEDQSPSTSDGVSTNGAGPKSVGSTNAGSNGAAASGGRPNLDKADASSTGTGAGGSPGSGGAGGSGGSSSASTAGGGHQPSVAAGARRPPGGSRPAKKRGKGGRRGGRR
jgi:YidC/Oxa1 family membrane protein insertase